MSQQDFTSYNETDPGSDLTVDASSITFATLDRGLTSYVGKDLGAGYFNGNFQHHFAAKWTALTSNGSVLIWAIANVLGSRLNIAADGDGLGIFFHQSGGNIIIRVREWDAASPYNDDGVVNLTVNNLYYFKVRRDEDVGTYGTIYVDFYSDVDRTNLVESLSITLHGSKKDYRSIHGLSNFDDASSGSSFISGVIQNLDLREFSLVTSSPIVIFED